MANRAGGGQPYISDDDEFHEQMDVYSESDLVYFKKVNNKNKRPASGALPTPRPKRTASILTCQIVRRRLCTLINTSQLSLLTATAMLFSPAKMLGAYDDPVDRSFGKLHQQTTKITSSRRTSTTMSRLEFQIVSWNAHDVNNVNKQ